MTTPRKSVNRIEEIVDRIVTTKAFGDRSNYQAARAACIAVATAVIEDAARMADYYPNRFDMADTRPSLAYGCDEIAGSIRKLKNPKLMKKLMAESGLSYCEIHDYGGFCPMCAENDA